MVIRDFGKTNAFPKVMFYILVIISVRKTKGHLIGTKNYKIAEEILEK